MTSIRPGSFNEIHALLDTLSSASDGDLFAALSKYENDDTIAVLAKRLLAGGGGSGGSSYESAYGQGDIVGGTADYLSYAHNDGSAVLDYTNPKRPAFIAAGAYVVVMESGGVPATAAIAELDLSTGNVPSITSVSNMNEGVATDGGGGTLQSTLVCIAAAGDTIDGTFDHSGSGGNATLHFYATLLVLKVGG